MCVPLNILSFEALAEVADCDVLCFLIIRDPLSLSTLDSLLVSIEALAQLCIYIS